MGFRSLEISNPAEVHIKNGQMYVEQETGTAIIPLEDIATITCIGTNIRFSTMGLTKLAEYGITMQCVDQHYKPKAMVLSNESNVRQTLEEKKINPMHTPGILCNHHGPFTWGKDANAAVYHAVVLEEVAKMARMTESLNPQITAAPQFIIDKHFNRKHGANAYYGQPGMEH